jgi:LuxR family maltose regulon positive regulatory protein
MSQSDTSLERRDKLCPPDLHDVMERPRLFAMLDRTRRMHAVTWIASPPGAGKTTLVASYLTSSGARPIWYQVDGSDADPASFFFHLAQAVQDAGRSMPRFASEAAHNPKRFARHFFREFFDCLKPGTVVVFDNLQDFDWTDQGELFDIALQCIPESVHVVAISREAPPARLTRLILTNAIGTLQWTDIRFNATEAQDLARLDASMPSSSAQWLERLDGWAAGLVRLGPALSASPHHGKPTLPAGLDTVFAYFANAIFSTMPEPLQHHLMTMSLLPALSASDAIQLTENPEAGKLLENLYRNRMFVDRRGTTNSTYQFHALFRDFLRHEAEATIPATKYKESLRRAASLLLGQRKINEAAELYRDAGEWALLVSLLLDNAREMLAAGMALSWREWHDWLPVHVVARDPWLAFWLGYALHFVNPVEGRRALIRAENIFRERNDLPARLLAICGILDAYSYSWTDLNEVPYWVTEMNSGLRAVDPRALDAKTNLRIHSTLVLALLLTDFHSPRVQISIEHAREALPLVESLPARLAAASRLLFNPEWLPTDMAHGITAELGGAAEDESLAPSPRAWWCLATAQWHFELGGDLDAAQSQIVLGLRLVLRYGMDRLYLRLQYLQVLVLLAAGDTVTAGRLVAGMQPMLKPELKLDQARFETVQAQLALQTGKVPEGLAAARRALSQIQESGQPEAELPRFERFMAGASAASGDFEAAAFWYERAIRDGAESNTVPIELEKEICAVYAAYLNARTDYSLELVASRLEQVIARHRQSRDHGFFTRFPRLAGEIATLCLRSQIDVGHIQGIIRRQRLQPVDRSATDWPWPIAIRSLGKLSVTNAEASLTPAGKAQQRPLQVLKALLIAGPAGRSQNQLAAQLWPEADDPKAAMNVTLHRLRKMVNDDDAIRVESGVISLNPRLVWTDVEALHQLCSDIADARLIATSGQLRRFGRELLALYAGPFLDGDDASWILPVREKVRSTFLHAANQLGTRLEETGLWSDANDFYLRCLGTEPLEEVLYRGLMRCADARGDTAGAYSAYRQCREGLAAAFARKPSVETDRLAARLHLWD